MAETQRVRKWRQGPLVAEIGGPPQLEKNNWRLRDVRSRKCAPYPARRAEPGRRCRPFTGAWIETPHHIGGRRGQSVAPSRGRGLKRIGKLNGIITQGVAPSRGRGLKRFNLHFYI